MTRHLKLNRLLALSKAWSVDEALWILQVYGCQRDEILWKNFWTTAYEMGLATDPDCHCAEIHVRFLGGPGNGGAFTGPFSMFVVDRVLWHWKRHEISWEWLLHFNSDTTAHIRDQLKYTRPLMARQKCLPGFEREERFRDERFGDERFGDERDGHYESPPFCPTMSTLK